MKTKFNKEAQRWAIWLIERSEWMKTDRGRILIFHSKQEAQARIDLAEDWQ